MPIPWISDLSNNPSPEALQELAKKLQEMKSSSKDGQSAIAELAGKLVDLAREAANAKINVDSLNKSTDIRHQPAEQQHRKAL